MAAIIKNTANCEVTAVIHFLWEMNRIVVDTHLEICTVYGKNITVIVMLDKLYCLFTDGQTNVHDEKRNGRASVVTDELVEKEKEKSEKTSVSKLWDLFPFPLRYRKQFCTKW